ncbi:phosphoribosylanthranilate isomerase [Paenibacillus sp. IHBB 10380]|uniref:phosphoribosylanthranilate isomerase n=1 Tax=Paenibacillus sp. IHBB 10380 TaxID=1566358 RepID=UPI0005CFEFB8|nr:phosphoribosylanthranilate isomerase [Paenibacillus sp. IHBB 10380]AJS58043.1 N-(5'-phosphoribosyl)anthranilate isomerase [Paenibacillus sp. IHBB 10380]
MGSALVKICGLQDVEVLKYMNDLPVDYIGFVFAKSRRQVSVDTAAILVPQLSKWQNEKTPESVGVFVNPTMEQLSEVMDRVSLDVIQLHGQEKPEFCRKVKQAFGVKIFKVIQIQRTEDTSDSSDIETALQEYIGVIDAVLLDTFDPVHGGGSGKTFAWEQITRYQDWSHHEGIPLWIAGGLDPDNVEELLELYHPHGVDVSSGVESNGIKDIDKIKTFVERVKGL